MIKNYHKNAVQPMFPWEPDMNVSRVSISEADADNGSPKIGDMIAVSPSNPDDKWLVAEKYFKENYEEVTELNSQSEVALAKPHDSNNNDKLTLLMRNVLSSFRRQLVPDNSMTKADFESYLDTTVVQIETLIGE